MISTANITKTKNTNSIYVPLKYAGVPEYILEENNVDYTRLGPLRVKLSPEDIAVRTKWTEKFEKALNVSYFSPRLTAEYRVNLDPEEFFDLLINTIKYDTDAQNHISKSKGFLSTPSKTILE